MTRILKKTGKIAGIIFLGIVCLVVLFGIGVKIYDIIQLNKEEKSLNEYGVGKSVEVNGKNINVYSAGEKGNGHTVVFMAGLGMGDVTVSMRPVSTILQKDNRIVIIDRAGYGMSDDTKKDRSVENIVEEYRATLNAAGEKAPYTILAHSISGMYALYWEQMYPDEIESIVFLDADAVERYADAGKADKKTLFNTKVQKIMTSSGILRLLSDGQNLIGDDWVHTFTDEQNTMRKYLMFQNTLSNAMYSEMTLYYENAKKVLEKSVYSEIPKLYICTDSFQGNYYDNYYKNVLDKRYNGDKKRIQQCIETYYKQRNEKINYFKNYGNVKLVNISGPHCIYEYNPTKVANEVHTFLNELEQEENE